MCNKAETKAYLILSKPLDTNACLNERPEM